MPLIEFRCSDCNKKFEELIYRRDEVENVVCPYCSAASCERLFSTFGLRSSGVKSQDAGTSCTSCSRTSCTGCSQ